MMMMMNSDGDDLMVNTMTTTTTMTTTKMLTTTTTTIIMIMFMIMICFHNLSGKIVELQKGILPDWIPLPKSRAIPDSDYHLQFVHLVARK